MAKIDKGYPEFECYEYDYGELSHREYWGSISAKIRFSDKIESYSYFDFKEFLDFHKRKKSDFHRSVEKAYSRLKGWGSRYFELIEELQDDTSVDLFALFSEFIELFDEDLAEKYERRRNIAENHKAASLDNAQEAFDEGDEDEDDDDDEDDDIDDEITEPLTLEKVLFEDYNLGEILKEEFGDLDDEDIAFEAIEEEVIEISDDDSTDENKIIHNTPPLEISEDDDEDDEETPYERDRKQFYKIVEEASDDMYEALKTNFFPNMEYYSRRYPTRWKNLTPLLDDILLNFVNTLQQELMPVLNEREFHEFDIKYNSQQADMSDDDEPPTAR